jgi:flagellar biosynthesis GTPase FlhF
VLSKEQREDFADNITLFCDLYRASLQTSQATPKLHILEAHMVDFMAAWHTIGIFGEDAIESLHAKLNVIFRRVHGIRNCVAKLKSAWGLLDQSQHGAALEVAAQTREQSKRKFKDDDDTREAKRNKTKETKSAMEQELPKQPLLKQHQKAELQQQQQQIQLQLQQQQQQQEEEQEQELQQQQRQQKEEEEEEKKKKKKKKKKKSSMVDISLSLPAYRLCGFCGTYIAFLLGRAVGQRLDVWHSHIKGQISQRRGVKVSGSG